MWINQCSGSEINYCGSGSKSGSSNQKSSISDPDPDPSATKNRWDKNCPFSVIIMTKMGRLDFLNFASTGIGYEIIAILCTF